MQQQFIDKFRQYYWLINGLMFQLTWFVSVYFGDLAAVASAVVFLLVHIPFAQKNEWLLILQVSVLGWFYNQILFRTEVLVSDAGAPIWLHAIWPMFAATLCHSLNYFTTRRWLLVVCGMVLAPVAYYSGALLSGTQMGLALPAYLLAISLSWAVLMLLFHFMVKRLITDSK